MGLYLIESSGFHHRNELCRKPAAAVTVQPAPQHREHGPAGFRASVLPCGQPAAAYSLVAAPRNRDDMPAPQIGMLDAVRGAVVSPRGGQPPARERTGPPTGLAQATWGGVKTGRVQSHDFGSQGACMSATTTGQPREEGVTWRSCPAPVPTGAAFHEETQVTSDSEWLFPLWIRRLVAPCDISDRAP